MDSDPRKMFPRTFVPHDADMGQWSAIESLGEELLRRAIRSPQDLEQWLMDTNELERCIYEVRTVRSVAASLQTDDPEIERAYKAFLTEVEARWKPMLEKLYRKYLDSPHRSWLSSRYQLFDRKTRTRTELFRETNVPLETEEDNIKQEHQKISGTMTVAYRGETLTLPQMQRYLADPQRSVRQEAWELIVERTKQDRDQLDNVLGRLIALRTKIARNAGFASYLEYVFAQKMRFDYTPANCVAFHDAVASYAIPAVARLNRSRQTALGLDRLRPWDLGCDILGRPPLRPYANIVEFLDGCEEVIACVSTEFGEWFRFMRNEKLLDLESRKGKRAGGYQALFPERRWPFIFWNATGKHLDVIALLHECGHAFHALASRGEWLNEYLVPPEEFAEVASMSMEFLALPHLGAFYSEAQDIARAQQEQFERALRMFSAVALFDSFQYWLYTRPEHTIEERRQKWIELYQRYIPLVDWSSYEEALASSWQQTVHFFQYPLYHIVYGIAQIGALQVFLNAERNYRVAVDRYRYALQFGGSRTTPELFKAAGVRFAFDANTIRPLVSLLEQKLETLSA